MDSLATHSCDYQPKVNGRELHLMLPNDMKSYRLAIIELKPAPDTDVLLEIRYGPAKPNQPYHGGRTSIFRCLCTLSDFSFLHDGGGAWYGQAENAFRVEVCENCQKRYFLFLQYPPGMKISTAPGTLSDRAREKRPEGVEDEPAMAFLTKGITVPFGMETNHSYRGEAS